MSLFNHPGLLEIRLRTWGLETYKRVFLINKDDVVSIDAIRSPRILNIETGEYCEDDLVRFVELNILDSTGTIHSFRQEYDREEPTEMAHNSVASEVYSAITSVAPHSIIAF